jgi:hypothetical protein
MNSTKHQLLVGLLVSLGACPRLHAQGGDWAETQRILPAELAFLQGAGEAIAVDGARLVLGDPADDEGNLAGVGSVSWYEKVGELYALKARLRGPVLAAGDFYGSAVDVRGARLAVGAPAQDAGGSSDAGAVHLYDLSGATEVLLASLFGASSGAEFGAAVSLHDGRLAVGAPGEDGGRGAVYIWIEQAGAWSLQARVQPLELQPGDRYGSCVALHGTRLVAGAPSRAVAGLDGAGSAWIHEQSLVGWQPVARLDGATGEARLGSSVAIDATRAAIGAPGANQARVWIGGAGSWTEEEVLAGAVPGSAFGAAVALRGELLAVGAPEDSSAVFRSGSVRLHARSGGAWVPAGVLAAGGFQTLYGSALDLDADLVFGGAPGLFGGGFFSVGGGVVHEVRIQRLCSGPALPCPCGSGEAGCVNSSGQSARLDGAGATSLAADGFVLSASGLPAGACAFVQATDRSAPSPFGDGLLCVAGTRVRLGTRTSSAGVASLPAPGGASLSQLGGLSAGGVRLYQVWYRDGAAGHCSPASFNASDALRVVWRP